MKSKSLVLASILAISTAAFAQSPPAPTPGPGGPRAERMGPPGGPHGGPHGMHDGKPMTRAEAMAKAGEHFDRVDTNKDGTLDVAERKAAHEKMRAMHEQRKAAKGGDGPMPAPAGK